MIVTVTPNPSVDRTVSIDSLNHGAVHRASDVIIEAGGKGVNVARALARGGVESTCVFPAGSDDSAMFVRLLGDIDDMTSRTVPISGSIRTNVGVIEADGRTTKFNEAGSVFGVDAQDELLASILSVSVSASWVVLCGSYPPGLPSDFVSRVRRELPSSVLLGVDASGAPLAEAVAVGCDVIKPNHHELGELVGRHLGTLGEVADAATDVYQRGVSTVLVSLGSRGAILVDSEGATFASAPTSEVKNTVGAGDAFFAGFLAAGGSGTSALSEALAWGRAAVRAPSTDFAPATANDRAAVLMSDEIDREMKMEH
ncbi:1-phosphofructokinase-like [Stigmatopora argus]